MRNPTPTRSWPLPATLVLALTFLALPASAQNVPGDEPLREVVRQQQALLAAQQKQLAAQQAQLDAQSKLLKDLEKKTQKLETKGNTRPRSVAATRQPTPSTAPGAKQALDGSSGGADLSSIREGQLLNPANFSYEPASAVNRGLSNRSRHDLADPTGSNFSYTPAAAVLRDPKTGTEVGIHGFAQFQAMHDSDDLDNNEFDTYGIPIDGAPSRTNFSVNPSRLGIDSKTPLGWGRLNTLVSLDLNGQLSDPEWRLREAYGEIINDEKDFAFLFGQTYSTGLDLRSVPETLDFAGPTGYFARRQPQVRFSKLFGHKVMLNLAAETPENATYFAAGTRTRWPDLVGAVSWDIDGDYLSHLRVMGMVRDLQATDNATGAKDSAVGWNVGASGKIKLPFLGERDNLKFGAQYGDGFGATLKSGPYDGVFDPGGSLETIGVFSAYGGIQHWWGDKWRSNLVGGYAEADNPGYLDPDRLDNTYYLAANLVWNPLPHVTFGLEYLHGRRENVDGNSGDASRVLFSSKFTF